MRHGAYFILDFDLIICGQRLFEAQRLRGNTVYIKYPGSHRHRSGFFTVNFEQISQIVLVLALLTLNESISAGLMLETERAVFISITLY